MPDEPPIGPDSGEPAASVPEPVSGETRDTVPEPDGSDARVETAPSGGEPGSDTTEVVPAPDALDAPNSPPESSVHRGQRRITRHTTTTRTETETTTDETVVEDVAIRPPVWAAPGSAHPRPVG